MTTRRSIALILSPFGLLLISAARLIIVSDYNTTTAVTVASSGGFINTLLGSVIPLVPLFIPYLALLLLLFRRYLLSLLTFVFAAYITPSPISLADALGLARADWQQLVGQVSAFRMLAAMLVLLVLVVLWAYNRSLPEAVSAVGAAVLAVALLLAEPSGAQPGPVRQAGAHEQRLVAQVSAGLHGPYGVSAGRIIIIVIVFLVIAACFGLYRAPEETRSLLAAYAGRLPWLLNISVAAVATVAFLPYVYNIYPIPHRSSYYATVAHTMWLPTEKLTLESGRIEYGYVLTSSDGWFTVLTAPGRTIAYIPAEDVAGRSVCQPESERQPQPYPPLVTTLYIPPPHMAPCSKGGRFTSIRSVRSQGQSLKLIAAIAHVFPGRIISITNAYQHEQLSAALRRYERGHNWKAPTPVGQHFWYYPAKTP